MLVTIGQNWSFGQDWSRQFVKKTTTGFTVMSVRDDGDGDDNLLDYDLTSSVHAILQSSDKLDLVNHK